MMPGDYYALCVDDDQAVLDQLDLQLRDYLGDVCDVECAESAAEALSIYDELVGQGKHVWLVISDQVMPGMFGDELLARIHERDRQAIKVLLTGQAGLASTIRAINHAGLNYYLEKPWSYQDLKLILDKLKFQYEMTTVLNEMNLRFASSIDLDQTLNTVFYNILNIIQAEAGSIFLVEETQHMLVCKICQGPKNILDMRVPLGAGIVGYVAATRQIDVTTDVQQDNRHYGRIDKQTGFVTKTMVSVPLITKDTVLGVIQVINKKGEKSFSQDDLLMLQALSNGAALAIQNAQYAARLVHEERIRSELLIAHQIQQGILPDPFEGHPEIHFEAVNEPAKAVGGDFYDYFQVSADEFAFFIGDVCGKGVPAAIFMASCRSIIKSQALTNPQPAHVMRLANRLVVQDAKHHGLYVTVFYGVYNLKTRCLHYVNAGHPPPLLFRKAQSACSSIVNSNLPIGMFDQAVFENDVFRLEKGDTLILYTDGINEAENAAREQFGMEQLVQIVLSWRADSPKELQDTILERVKTFAIDQDQRDDMTMLIVQV